MLRIVGHPKYPNSSGPPSMIAAALTAIREFPGHDFWPDGISMVESELIDPTLLSSHARVTDSYLLALAPANRGSLATLDHKLAAEAVVEGSSALTLI